MSERMTGTVRGHTALVAVGSSGAAGDTEFVVDTGYTGWLLLPRAEARRWQLAPRGSGRAVLADGSTLTVQVFTAVVDWLGELRTVYIVVIPSGEPLLGFRMLVGTRVTLHEITVEIERIAVHSIVESP